MKYVYQICIQNSLNQMVRYTVISTSMTAAIALAQTKAGVTADPQSFQFVSPVDVEG